MHLIPFEMKHYPLLIDWVSDEEFSLLWGGPCYSWPITVEQISAHQARTEVSSFILVSDKNKIGFIELFKVNERHYRLCRVLVAVENSRGKGLGKQLVSLAMDRAKNEFGADKVSLGVFEKNERAISCY